MCRKLLLLIAVLGLVGTVWADDPNPPEWRGEPGSTVSHWTYDDPPLLGPSGDPYPSEDSFPRLDAADVYSYVPHPDKANPDNYVQRAIEEYWDVDYPEGDYEAFAMQLWGDYLWTPEYKGRTGVLAPFDAGSWDIFNFWSQPPQPYKEFWIQMTWRPFEITTGWYECEEYLWNFVDWGDPEVIEGGIAGGTLNLGETYYDDIGDPVYLGEPYDTEVVGFDWELEYMPQDDYWDDWEALGYGEYEYYEQLAPFEVVDHLDGWETWKFAFSVPGNPFKEFLGLFPVGTPEGDPYEMYGSEFEMPTADWDPNLPPPYTTWMEGEVEWGWLWLEAIPGEWDPLWGDPQDIWMQQDRGPAAIAIDQIDIDTYCVPEPATIALLGLGGLFLIRRRKQR